MSRSDDSVPAKKKKPTGTTGGMTLEEEEPKPSEGATNEKPCELKRELQETRVLMNSYEEMYLDADETNSKLYRENLKLKCELELYISGKFKQQLPVSAEKEPPTCTVSVQTQPVEETPTRCTVSVQTQPEEETPTRCTVSVQPHPEEEPPTRCTVSVQTQPEEILISTLSSSPVPALEQLSAMAKEISEAYEKVFLDARKDLTPEDEPTEEETEDEPPTRHASRPQQSEFDELGSPPPPPAQRDTGDDKKRPSSSGSISSAQSNQSNKASFITPPDSPETPRRPSPGHEYRYKDGMVKKMFSCGFNPLVYWSTNAVSP